MPYNWVVVKPLLAPPEVPDAEKKDYSMQVHLYIHSHQSISHTNHYIIIVWTLFVVFQTKNVSVKNINSTVLLYLDR